MTFLLWESNHSRKDTKDSLFQQWFADPKRVILLRRIKYIFWVFIFAMPWKSINGYGLYVSQVWGTVQAWMVYLHMSSNISRLWVPQKLTVCLFINQTSIKCLQCYQHCLGSGWKAFTRVEITRLQITTFREKHFEINSIPIYWVFVVSWPKLARAGNWIHSMLQCVKCSGDLFNQSWPQSSPSTNVCGVNEERTNCSKVISKRVNLLFSHRYKNEHVLKIFNL